MRHNAPPLDRFYARPASPVARTRMLTTARPVLTRRRCPRLQQTAKHSFVRKEDKEGKTEETKRNERKKAERKAKERRKEDKEGKKEERKRNETKERKKAERKAKERRNEGNEGKKELIKGK